MGIEMHSSHGHVIMTSDNTHQGKWMIKGDVGPPYYFQTLASARQWTKGHAIDGATPLADFVKSLAKPLLILLAVFFLASCGSPRTPGVAGPGDTRLGQTIQQVEHDHPKWTLEGVQVLPDGREARQYRDWHWSLGAGVAHSAEHHVLYFRSGVLESWNEQ